MTKAVGSFTGMTRAMMGAEDLDLLVKAAYGDLSGRGDFSKLGPNEGALQKEAVSQLLRHGVTIARMGGAFNLRAGYCGLHFAVQQLKWSTNLLSDHPDFTTVWQDAIFGDRLDPATLDVMVQELLAIGHRGCHTSDFLMFKLSMS